MKIFHHLRLPILAVLFLNISACQSPATPKESDEPAKSTEQDQVEAEETSDAFDPVGMWMLVSLDGEKVPGGATDCDKQTNWNFTENEAEPLDDGTKVYQLIVTAPEECKWYDFEAKWTRVQDQLFISSCRVGGMGGLSNAGLFDIVEANSGLMILEILGTRYTFERS